MTEFKVGLLWESEIEATIIGRLVLGYTELEVAFWRVLAASLQDEAQATRVMFRSKNTENRLLVADAIISKSFSGTNYEQTYSNTFGELNSCRSIRNSLAHAYWERENGALQYVKLEDAALSKDGIISAKRELLSIKKLREKEAIFCRVYSSLGDLEAAMNGIRLAAPFIKKAKDERRTSADL